MEDRSPVTRYAWLTIAAALATIALKTVAYLMTQSVGLLSDALESVVNLVVAVAALAVLKTAVRPPDEGHAYGHEKAEYFSSVIEGTLIFVAAISIAIVAVERLIAPRPLQQIGAGLAISVAAAAINLAVAVVLLRAGARHRSITLQAGGRHLLADVTTSAGVLIGVGAVALTGRQVLDPLVALAVAASILWSGFRLIRMSVAGLMDSALPERDLAALRQVLERYAAEGVEHHALRTREAGARRFVSLHVLVPGAWTVHRGHALLERLEADIRAAVPNATVFTHLESLDDPASWDDQTLDRTAKLPPAGRG